MFKCQQDSFLKQLETTVVSCEEISDRNSLGDFGPIDVEDGQKIFRVTLEETILFPEGGGQPDDRGTIGKAKVVRVIRDGSLAVHYVTSDTSPFSPGDKVHVELDWDRRFDHMQQHSGQHLITAIADKELGFPTTSWYLGKEDSFIEMDTKQITDEQKNRIEQIVNEKILEGHTTNVDVVDLDDPKLKTARGRNLPADVTGNIRIVTMPGIESNVCCGTHVSSLWQLQQIKLLQALPKKGKVQLFFVAGNRVAKRFNEMYKRELELGKVLKTNPNDYASACEKLNAALKLARKNLTTLTKEIADFEAAEFVKKVQNASENKYHHFHRENVDVDYAPVFLRGIKALTDQLLFLSFKIDQTSGNVYIIRGKNTIDDATFDQVCEQVSSLLDGKGTRRGDQYQAKISKCNAIPKAGKLLEPLLTASITGQ